MRFGPVTVTVVPVESHMRLVNGKPLGVALFVCDSLGPSRNEVAKVNFAVPSIHAPMFREDGSHVSSVVVCRQPDKGIQVFLLFHELLHAVAWVLHFPPRTHFWIDKLVRSQVLDTPCPPK